MAALIRHSMTMMLLLSAMTGSSEQLIRCWRDGDCPLGGVCFKDECARCLCQEGRRVINFYDGNTLRKLCESKPNRKLQVGAACKVLTRDCPRGTTCDSGACTCSRTLVPHADLSHCRRPVFGERCTKTRPCASGQGLRCTRRAGECRCKPSHRRPSAWTRMVLRRWDYSRVSGSTQSCIARAVGEPCRLNVHCAGVKGSGAICGVCGVCRCKAAAHVPDVLGTRCGEPLDLGQSCLPQSDKVCNGYEGLQCGTGCEFYVTDPRRKLCTCSQMHDRRSGKCVPKTIDSGCRTDLDCYPVREGFGYCDKGRCHAASSSSHHRPYMVKSECKNQTSTAPPPVDQPKTTRVPSTQYDVTSEVIQPTTTLTTTSFPSTTPVKYETTFPMPNTTTVTEVRAKSTPTNSSIIFVESKESLIYVIETRLTRSEATVSCWGHGGTWVAYVVLVSCALICL